MRYSEFRRKVAKSGIENNTFSRNDIPVLGQRKLLASKGPRGRNLPYYHHSAYQSPKNERQPQHLFSFTLQNSLVKDQKENGRQMENLQSTFQKNFDGYLSNFSSKDWDSNSQRNAIEQCLRQIQVLWKVENMNLKQQNQYLTSLIRKIRANQQNQIEIIQKLQIKNQQLQNQRNAYKSQYQQVKSYIFNGMNKTQNIVTDDDSQLLNSLGNNQKMEQTTFSNNPLTLHELNQRFEQSLRKYRLTQNPQYRRMSAQLAKRIRKYKTLKLYGKQKYLDKTLSKINDRIKTQGSESCNNS